ncbi:MAG: SUF system NifU family Fe-S cluster assembly protein [Puniceicoccales bacterium]|jgi:nitrogen fixation NifU-like protein|nr:SUF system NifU family Fe-S cluster assembly protein [Puniceicoccales bacterium]
MVFLDELYQEIIIDHSNSPRNEGELERPTHSAEAYNATCGDELVLHLSVVEGNLQAIRFRAQGCSIVKASASMMGEKVQTMTVAKALAFSKKIQALLNGEVSDILGDGELGELVSLLGVRQFPMRVKCATLPWHALDNALKSRDVLPPETPYPRSKEL